MQYLFYTLWAYVIMFAVLGYLLVQAKWQKIILLKRLHDFHVGHKKTTST